MKVYDDVQAGCAHAEHPGEVCASCRERQRVWAEKAMKWFDESGARFGIVRGSYHTGDLLSGLERPERGENGT